MIHISELSLVPCRSRVLVANPPPPARRSNAHLRGGQPARGRFRWSGASPRRTPPWRARRANGKAPPLPTPSQSASAARSTHPPPWRQGRRGSPVGRAISKQPPRHHHGRARSSYRQPSHPLDHAPTHTPPPSAPRAVTAVPCRVCVSAGSQHPQPQRARGGTSAVTGLGAAAGAARRRQRRGQPTRRRRRRRERGGGGGRRCRR